MLWITDTQYLSESDGGLFTNTTQWIAKYYAACNGRMVVHTGDVVGGPPNAGNCSGTDDYGSKWTSDPQWTAADQAMTVLLSANIPYTWDAGNNDGCLGSVERSSLADGWIGWNYAAFNPSTVQNASLNWVNAEWVGSDNDGMDTAVSFSGAGQNFLLVNIQYNGVDELAKNGWVQQLLSSPSYVGYHVIIATHDFIDNFGGTDLPDFPANLTCVMDGCNGQKGYPNVFLTLSGHFDFEDQGYHAETSSGQYELMFDRQNYDGRKGAATVTILTFDVGNSKIYVNTFDVANPSADKDSTLLSSPSYQYQLDQSFQLNQSSEIPVTCVPSYTIVGLPVTCRAVVGGSSPTGVVTWSSSSAAEAAPVIGVFSSTSCTLVGGACSVTYVPTERYDTTQTVMVTARYSGDSQDRPAVGTASLSAALATTKTTVRCTSPLMVSGSNEIDCTARVAGYSPTGIVTWPPVDEEVDRGTTGAMVYPPVYPRCALSNGRCSLTMTGPRSGTLTIMATYPGDSHNQGSSGLAILTYNASTTTTTTPLASISTTSSGGSLGIPELPVQLGITLLAAVVIVMSYAFSRHGLRRGKQGPPGKAQSESMLESLPARTWKCRRSWFRHRT